MFSIEKPNKYRETPGEELLRLCLKKGYTEAWNELKHRLQFYDVALESRKHQPKVYQVDINADQ